jgi:tape measure domain-containing protein
MAKNVVQDWVVEVGWNDSKVIKGQKRLEKLMSKVDKVSARIASTQDKKLAKQNDQLRKQNALESQRLSLRKKIAQAEALGFRDLKKERGALGGTNPLKIRQQILDLDKRITVERKKQRELEVRKKAEQAAIKAQPKAFSLPSHQRLKEELKIDNIVENARKSLSETSKEFRVINNEARRLKSELAKVGSRDDLVRLQNQTMRLRRSTAEATAKIREQTRAMNAQKFVAKGVTDSIRNMARSYVSIFAAVEAGRAIVRTVTELDSLNASLLAAGGNAEQAGKDFEFIKVQSERLGFSLTESAKGWTQIGAAGRASNLTMEETKEVWLAGTEAARAFGLDSQRLGFVHLALSQIISKGKVSMEELRRQLGEHLPGAMSIAAKAMGVTTMELEKMVEAGIPAEEFLPKFAKELRNSVKESGALEASLKKISAEQGRFINALQRGLMEASGAGASEGIQQFFKGLTDLVKGLTPLFKGLGIAIRLVGLGFGTLVRVASSIASVFTSLVGIIGETVSGILRLGDVSKDSEGNIIKLGNTAIKSWRGWNTEIEEVILNFELLGNEIQLIFALLQRFFKMASEELKFTLNPAEAIRQTGAFFDKFNASLDESFKKASITEGSPFAGTAFTKSVPLKSSTTPTGGTNTYNVTFNTERGSKEEIRSNWESFMQENLKVALP